MTELEIMKVLQAYFKLDDEDQLIVYAKLKGYSLREIEEKYAEELGISYTAIRRRFNRAFKQIQKRTRPL